MTVAAVKSVIIFWFLNMLLGSIFRYFSCFQKGQATTCSQEVVSTYPFFKKDVCTPGDFLFFFQIDALFFSLQIDASLPLSIH